MKAPVFDGSWMSKHKLLSELKEFVLHLHNCLGEPPMPKVNIEQLCSERTLVQILFSVSNVIL